MASTPVPSQERTAPVLMLERATEPHAFRVLPGARSRAVHARPDALTSAVLTREKGHLPTMRHEAPMQVGLQRKSGLGRNRERVSPVAQGMS